MGVTPLPSMMIRSSSTITSFSLSGSSSTASKGGGLVEVDWGLPQRPSSQCHAHHHDFVGWRQWSLLTLTSVGTLLWRTGFFLHGLTVLEQSFNASDLCSVISNGAPHSIQLFSRLTKCFHGLLLDSLNGVALFLSHLLLCHSGQQV